MSKTSDQQKDAKITLTYNNFGCELVFREGVKTNRVGDRTEVYCYQPDITTNARVVISDTLEKYHFLPREISTTIDLINGVHELEMSPHQANKKVELTKEQIDYLKFFRKGDLCSVVSLNDTFRGLEEMGYISTKLYQNYDSSSVGVSPHNMFLVRVEETNPEKLERGLKKVQQAKILSEIQQKYILKALNRLPKTEIFRQEIVQAPHRVIDSELINLYNVPEPVADWLSEIWKQKKKDTLPIDTEMALKELENFIRANWKPFYPSYERPYDPREPGFIEESIKHFLEEGKEGILHGITRTRMIDCGYGGHYIDMIDFDERRKKVLEQAKKIAA